MPIPITLLYGGLCAMAQQDFKKLVAYASVSSMGFVLLGIASIILPALIMWKGHRSDELLAMCFFGAFFGAPTPCTILAAVRG